MGKWSDLIKLLLFFAVVYGGIALLIYRAKRKKREAEEYQAAQQRAIADRRRVEQEEHEAVRRREADRRRVEQEEREAERRRKSEEAARIQQEKLDRDYAEYDRIMDSLEVYPITVSETKSEKLSASALLEELTYSTITKKTDRDKLGDFVVVDTETTGLNCGSCEIIEIAAIRFRGFKPVAKFSTLLAPQKPIPASATLVNHITDKMVQGKPSFQQIAASFLDFIGSDNLVGHNLPFDLKFIVHYGADVTRVKRKYYDTLVISQKTIKKKKMKWDKEMECYVENWESDGVPNYKLDTLRAYLGIVSRGAHRAEDDAMTTGVLFEMLSDMRKG